MSVTSVKQWLYETLLESATEHPGIYPISGSAGVLYSYSFSLEDLWISKNRHSRFMDTDKPHLILHISFSPPTNSMGSGASKQLMQTHHIELEIWWTANFKGIGHIGQPDYIPPQYINQDDSAEDFERLLKALHFTIFKSFEWETAPSEYGTRNPKLIDNDGDESRIVGETPTIGSDYIEVISSSNDIDVIYRAMLSWDVKETYMSKRKQ